MNRMCSDDAPFCIQRRFALAQMLSSESIGKVTRNFLSVAAGTPSGKTTNMDNMAPPQVDALSNIKLPFSSVAIVVAYIVSFVVILVVIQRIYTHKYHFIPPYRRAYEELLAAHGLVQQGAIEFDNTREFGQFTAVPSFRGGVQGARGSGAESGTHETFETEADEQFPSEVLARLEEDLRATSFRERERLAAALNADLPSGRSFFFPIRSHSSRTVLPPEFDVSLDTLNRATQSARFTHVIVTSSPSSSAAADVFGNNDQLPPHNRSLFVPGPRSHSFRTLAPPAFDDSMNRAFSQSARFSAQLARIQSSPSTSARHSHWFGMQASPAMSAWFSPAIGIQASHSTRARVPPRGAGIRASSSTGDIQSLASTSSQFSHSEVEIEPAASTSEAGEGAGGSSSSWTSNPAPLRLYHSRPKPERR